MKRPKMKHWRRDHAQTCATRAREKWGRMSGWFMLSNDAKAQAVDAEVLSTLLLQLSFRDGEELTIPVEAIKELRREAHREAGLLDEED